jgi:predicted nucleic acid-binding protein
VILVDTSVLIDWFRKKDNASTKYFDSIVDTPGWGITDITFHEMLQGASSANEYTILDNYLSSQKIFYMPKNLDFFRTTANIYRTLREKGITIRSTSDTLIAGIAMHYDLTLLHSDRDFKFIGQHIIDLKVVDSN